MHLGYPQNFAQPFFSSTSLGTTIISRRNWPDLTKINAKFWGVNKVHRYDLIENSEYSNLNGLSKREFVITS